MAMHEIHIPLSINPKTGGRRYTEDQLAFLEPMWRRQWEEYSDFDSAMIDYIVKKLHVGPFDKLGSKIALGASRGMHKFMKEVAFEWRHRNPTGSQIYKEAKKRFNAFVRKLAEAYEVEDPFGAEYFLTSRERKMRRPAYG